MNGLKSIININNKYKYLYDIMSNVLKENDGITCHFPADMLENDKLLQTIMKNMENNMKGMDPNKIIKKIDRLYNNQMMNPVKLRMVGLIIEGIPLQFLKNIKIPIGTHYAMLQDASVLSGVIGFLVDIPQCTHCWGIGHKWQWCKEKKNEENAKRKQLNKLCNDGTISIQQKKKQWNEYSPKRYCKKCHKRGHNGNECTSKDLKCGICTGAHESIKCAKCPVIRKLITLYQKSIAMMDDGISIERIKEIDNDNILKYVSGNKYRQNQSQQMNSSSIDRGGNNNNNNNKKEEKKDDENNDDLSMQNNHNNPASNNSSIQPRLPTQQTQLTMDQTSVFDAMEHGTNNEIDQEFDDDLGHINKMMNTDGGPPIKKRKK